MARGRLGARRHLGTYHSYPGMAEPSGWVYLGGWQSWQEWQAGWHLVSRPRAHRARKGAPARHARQVPCILPLPITSSS